MKVYTVMVVTNSPGRTQLYGVHTSKKAALDHAKIITDDRMRFDDCRIHRQPILSHQQERGKRKTVFRATILYKWENRQEYEIIEVESHQLWKEKKGA